MACVLTLEARNATLKIIYVKIPDLSAELNFAKVPGITEKE